MCINITMYNDRVRASSMSLATNSQLRRIVCLFNAMCVYTYTDTYISNDFCVVLR